MFKPFSQSKIEVRLAIGDLLEGSVGRKHNPALVRMAKVLWPHWFIRARDERLRLGDVHQRCQVTMIGHDIDH